jgi:hypothetical protein
MGEGVRRGEKGEREEGRREWFSTFGLGMDFI